MSEKKSAKVPSNMKSKRPSDPFSLLMDGGDLPEIGRHGLKKPRYFIINLSYVIGEIGLQATASSTKKYFQEAQSIICNKTTWGESVESKDIYFCAIKQINEVNRDEAKLLDKCLTIIVALELAAAELKPDFDVYRYLRILPAIYYIDGFDASKLNELENYYDTHANLQIISGGSTLPFRRACSLSVGHGRSPELIDELVLQNRTATLDVCEGIVGFVQGRFPAALHIGPVCAFVERGHSKKLGRKRAAKSLFPDLDIPGVQLADL